MLSPVLHYLNQTSKWNIHAGDAFDTISRHETSWCQKAFLHHFRNACSASCLLIVNGMTFAGAKCPDKRSASIAAPPQKLHVVAVVSASVIKTAPQFYIDILLLHHQKTVPQCFLSEGFQYCPVFRSCCRITSRFHCQMPYHCRSSDTYKILSLPFPLTFYDKMTPQPKAAASYVLLIEHHFRF